MTGSNISKIKKTEIKSLISKGQKQGYLTISEINDILPQHLNDNVQIEEIKKLISNLKIKVVEKASDIENNTLIADDEVTDDEDKELSEEEAIEVLSSLDEEFGRTSDPVRMYMREMGTVELLDRKGEIVIAKKIENGQKLIYEAVRRFPETVSFFLKTFENTDELDSLISDYILDIKTAEDEEFKTDRLAESSPPINPKQNEKEEVDEAEENLETDSETDLIDNSPDKELVMSSIEDITELYGKYQELKNKKNKMVMMIPIPVLIPVYINQKS